MFDTHSHILYGMDDGSKRLSHAIGFAKQALKQGVHTLFATPHCYDGVYNCAKADIIDACKRFSHDLSAAGLPLVVLPGAEIRVNHDLIERFDNGELLTMNNAGKYLLIELPLMFIDSAVSMMIRKLHERDVIPIIAHAERNPVILNRPDLADQFIYHGAKIQVTASSLTGDFGRQVMRVSRLMCEKDQVFCLGSDIHPGRKYRMKKAAKRLNRWIGETATQLILEDNPACIASRKIDSENTTDSSFIGSASPGKNI
nr:CpsB/CapC family capsule biosynthesis tyrosine phosphatase [uncultured Desulfobacter sp.]